MLPQELIKKIRYIEIHTSKAVNDVLAGEYQSVFKGRGMAFDEVREYQPGDDVRTIDWNVTARTGHPYVKRYIEERELTVLFLVDFSASGLFGSIEKLKREVAAEFCALLAFSAIKNNDKVGLILFTDAVELFIPPKKGAAHVLRLIRELLAFSPQRKKTDIGSALDYLGRVMGRRGVVFLISDFIADDFQKPMQILAKRHDLIAVSITDPREHELPSAGLLALEDAETGEAMLVDTSDTQVRSRYRALASERKAAIAKLFAAMAIDHIAVATDRDYLIDLLRFFRARSSRRH